MESMICQEEKILVDKKKTGKIVDWKSKKISSIKLSKNYKYIAEKIKAEYDSRGVRERFRKIKKVIRNEKGLIMNVIEEDKCLGLYDSNGKRVVNYEKRSEDMKYCGSFLDFKIIKPDVMKLINSNFCRVPLCPMCQWRKSMRVFFEVSKIMRVIEERYPDYISVFITLTLKNCSGEELSSTLDNIFKGWFDFMRSYTLNPEENGKQRKIIKGWFRTLEVEYDPNELITQEMYNKKMKYCDDRGLSVGDKNPNFNMFHPHFHSIMLVDKSYFKGADYKHTEEWVQLWRKANKLDYDPICDIRRTYNKKKQRDDVAEVAKYTYKDAEILNNNLSDDKNSDVVKYLSSALHGRRLYAYGGVMKEIAAELKFDNIDKADLINVDDDNIDSTLAIMIVRYSWNMGLSNYTLTEVKRINEQIGTENNDVL
jgi:plasmid rolling circle replication initiator protein Rep